MRGLRTFLATCGGDEALRLGWTTGELFRVPPLWSNPSGRRLVIGCVKASSFASGRVMRARYIEFPLSPLSPTLDLTTRTIVPLLFSWKSRRLGVARSFGWKVHMRCTDGYRESTKSMRRCV
jgi:hypothetical protein